MKQLALTNPDYRTRLHALWTLDGLGEIDAATVEKALADKSVDVRVGAWLSERWLGEPASPLSAIVVKLGDDPNWMVRRQVAASLGMLPQASRVRPLVSMLEKYGADPITVDAATSGLAGLENEVLGLLLQGTATTPASQGAGTTPRPAHPADDAIATLSATIARGRDAASAENLVIAADTNRPMWQRVAVLRGTEMGLDGGGGGRGGGGGGGGRGGRGAAGPAGLTFPRNQRRFLRLQTGQTSSRAQPRALPHE